MKQLLPCIVASHFLLLLVSGRAFAEESPEDPEISGKPVCEWLKQIESDSRGFQARAGRTLAEAPKAIHAQLVPKLIVLLRAERENTRPWAAQALGEYGPIARAAVPDLMPLLQGTQFERNRAAAAKALGQILKGAEACEEVEKVTQELIRLFDDPYVDVRREALQACGMIGLAAQSCIPHLAKRMPNAYSSSPNTVLVGRAACWACGEFGKLAAMHTDLLISIVQQAVYHEPIEALGKVGPTHAQVVPNIVDRMEQVAAGVVKYKIGDRTHGMNADMIRNFMDQALIALEKYGPASEPAVPYLLRLISAPGWEKKKNYALGTLKALAAIGPKAAEAAVPVIEKNCLNAKDPDIQEAAKKALAALRGE